LKILTVAAAALVLLTGAAPAQDVSFGERLYQEKADCQFCHGPDGDGRGDPRSPGKAPDLRKAILQREHLIEVISCGRPGSEMPHFDKSAYEETNCYGLTVAQVGKDMTAHPHSNSLTQREIAAVADYVLKVFVGK